MDEKKPYSPVRSPTSPQFGFFPKRFTKSLQICVACILVIIFFSVSGFSSDLSYRSSLAREHFPKKIWQTWKVDPLSFEQRDVPRAKSWTAKNPGHRYEVLTDQNDIYYVEQHFGPAGFNRPDIVHMYKAITAKIIKADLLRYLVMYAEGGIYTDIDVEALKPADTFIPEQYAEGQIDMVIGIEIDQPEFSEHPVLGKKSKCFCQWTFMCKPGQPVMLRLIENIIEWLSGVAAEQHVSVSEIKLDFDEVILGTGPSAFTAAILEEMSKREGRAVTWNTFHNMRESKVVGGVLVLTVDAFAAGQGHSDSGNHEGRTALVKHHYHASGWPTYHPRYTHPMFGPVEACNWNPMCVAEWDKNKAEFDLLPAEEQARRIAIKKVEDEEAAREIEERTKQLEAFVAAQEAAQREQMAAMQNAAS